MLLQLISDCSAGIVWARLNGGIRTAGPVLVRPHPSGPICEWEIDHAGNASAGLGDQQATDCLRFKVQRPANSGTVFPLRGALRSACGTGATFFSAIGVALIDDLGHCYHRSWKWLSGRTTQVVEKPCLDTGAVARPGHHWFWISRIDEIARIQRHIHLHIRNSRSGSRSPSYVSIQGVIFA